MEWCTSVGRRLAAGLGALAFIAVLLPAAHAAAAEVTQDASGAAVAPPPSTPAPAHSISAELMKAIRAATFEVVLKKPQTDELQYDRPPPLDLLPFSIRNDKYESVGTAFAFAPGKFITAAHVATSIIGSMWGSPALRDAKGNVYPIDKVLRFSLDRDFMVFSAAGAPQVAPLPTSTSFQVDTPVVAVGNALGEGIVARDGTLTSETPEEQDGRWKWLRFSAPASPGNSGGPLLDAQGHVIGVILRKSANENLNYALPIEQVLTAPEKASFDTRYNIGLPFLTAHRTVKLQTAFDLPLPMAEFDRKFIALENQRVIAEMHQLLQDSAADVFPRGKSGRMLSEPFLSTNPALLTQQSDGRWDVPRSAAGSTTSLGGEGFVWVNAQAGGPVFRIHYPESLDVAKARGDSKLLIEQLLKGVAFVRSVGSERVRVTSMGKAARTEGFKDEYGRQWQELRYPLLYSDSTLIAMVLPVPDGYVGFERTSNPRNLDHVVEELRMTTNFFVTSYAGSLPQWRSFLNAKSMLPESFAKWQAALDPAGEVSLQLPRLAVKVNKDVLNLTERSQLVIHPGTLLDGNRAGWDVLAVEFNLESRRSASLVAVRRARPAEDASESATRRWMNMTQQTGPYAGRPMRDAQSFWVSKALSPGDAPLTDAAFLYDVAYITPTIVVQGEVPRAAPHLPEIFTVREK